MTFLIQIILSALFLLIGYMVGTYLEKKHYKSIIQREEDYSNIIVIASKYAPESSTNPKLEVGSVVIASDPFKRFVGWLIGIFGGRISAYESLLDRARREAVLRLKEKAEENGANMIINLKFETTTVGASSSKANYKAMFEVLAYGTCVKYNS